MRSSLTSPRAPVVPRISKAATSALQVFVAISVASSPCVPENLLPARNAVCDQRRHIVQPLDVPTGGNRRVDLCNCQRAGLIAEFRSKLGIAQRSLQISQRAFQLHSHCTAITEPHLNHDRIFAYGRVAD